MNHYTAQWQDIALGRWFALDRLIGTASELRLELTDETGRHLIVRFDAPVGYRRLDDGDALTMLERLAASAGTGRTFYEVESSDFLGWFHAESQGIWEGRGLRHFVVTTIDDMIDVLALDAPALETMSASPTAEPAGQ